MGLRPSPLASLAQLTDVDVAGQDGLVSLARLTYNADAELWMPRTPSAFDGQTGAPLPAEVWTTLTGVSAGTGGGNFGFGLIIDGIAYQTRSAFKVDLRDLTETATTARPYAGGSRHTSANGVIYSKQIQSPWAFYAYYPGSDTWLQRSDTPNDSSTAVIAGLDGYVYELASLNRFSRYDPYQNIWTARAVHGEDRRNGALIGAAGRIWYFGGALGGNFSPETDRAQSYDPVTDTWTDLASMPIAQTSGVAVYINGLFYIFGGGDAANDNTQIQVYSPQLDAWDVLSVETPAALVNGIGGVFNNRVVILQPTAGESASGNLWIFG